MSFKNNIILNVDLTEEMADMKQKKVSKKDLRAFVSQNPAMVGGNVKLMTCDVTFGMEEELVKLRKQTRNYKRDYKAIK